MNFIRNTQNCLRIDFFKCMSRNNQDVCNKNVYMKETYHYSPPRWPSGRVLASSAGGHGFNPQSRTASYQRRYKNGTSSALV